MEKNKYITIPELAKILGISRIAVYKKVKSGKIKAIKIGRNFAVSKKYVDNIIGNQPSEKDKKEIDTAIKKTVKEYGEVLKLLGRE
ncbi:MAG: helix-turn-helix domain-containing protein [Elusimicrobiota bacterium]|nr:helix-turn-helix domain-containing protein [Elusimicrobiota bacterium]